jgi:hypothetical protein
MGSFADGLMLMSQRNTFPRVNLTKKRALELERIIRLAIDYSPDCSCGKQTTPVIVEMIMMPRSVGLLIKSASDGRGLR